MTKVVFSLKSTVRNLLAEIGYAHHYFCLAFVQRCRDLLEVGESQCQFARVVDGGHKAQIPFFGGSRGPEVGKSLEDVEKAFEKHIKSLWEIRKYILDVKATRWHDDYNAFKQGIKDLEVMMGNIITSAFESATTVKGSVELLEIFHDLAQREAVKRMVEKKTSDIYRMVRIISWQIHSHKSLMWHVVVYQ